MSEASAVAPVIDDLIGRMDDEEFDIAFHEFFGNTASHNEVDQFENMLFEEWILFDWRDKNGKTLLDRGEKEPSFMAMQRQRCLELKNNVYSYWQVVDSMPGYGITVEDVYDDKQYKIRHKRYSTELPIDSIFCARLAHVDGRWMPASGFIEPQIVCFPQGGRADYFGKRPKDLNPCILLHKRRERLKNELSGKDEVLEMPLDEAKKAAKRALKSSGLNSYVSYETVESWVRSDLQRTPKRRQASPYPLAMSLLLGLGIGRKESDLQQLVAALIALNRSIAEEILTKPKDRDPDQHEIALTTFDPSHWMKLFDDAKELMHITGKESESVELFEMAFAEMHKQRTTNPLVFRQLHNVAIAYFYSGEEVLGRKALAASLSLNPVYDLGLKTEKALNKGELNQTITLSTIFRQAHAWAYRRKGQQGRRSSNRKTSPVIKYYEWIKEFDISFYDDSKTKQYKPI